MDVHVEPKPVDTACKGFACRKPFVVHIISWSLDANKEHWIQDCSFDYNMYVWN
jgi:hypothetical protein